MSYIMAAVLKVVEEYVKRNSYSFSTGKVKNTLDKGEFIA